jgi:hypothetical protein
VAEGSEAYTELERLSAVPDPDRDQRIEAYRDRERRRAARAMDRYIEVLNGPFTNHMPPELDVAGERFVEAVGDYVLSRMTGNPWGDAVQAHRDRVSEVQHNRHYGATTHDPGSHVGGCPNRDWVGEPYLPCETQHKSDYGAPAGWLCTCDASAGPVDCGGNEHRCPGTRAR